MEHMIREIDFERNKKIKYTEFLAASIDTSKFLTEARLQAIFTTFASDETNTISAKNIKDTFSKFNRIVTDHEVRQIMQTHDLDHDDEIKYQEFKKIIL